MDAAKADAEQLLTQLSKALGGQAGTPTVLSEGKPVANVLNGPGWLTTLLADNSSS